MVHTVINSINDIYFRKPLISALAAESWAWETEYQSSTPEISSLLSNSNFGGVYKLSEGVEYPIVVGGRSQME